MGRTPWSIIKGPSTSTRLGANPGRAANPQPFELRPLRFPLEAALFGHEGRLGGPAWFRALGGLPDQLDEPRPGILAVALLRAVPLGA